MPLLMLAAVLELLIKAPPDEMPVPLSMIGLLIPVVPFKSRTAPLVIVAVPVVVFWRPPKPSAVEFPICSVPPKTSVVPT